MSDVLTVAFRQPARSRYEDVVEMPDEQLRSFVASVLNKQKNPDAWAILTTDAMLERTWRALDSLIRETQMVIEHRGRSDREWTKRATAFLKLASARRTEVRNEVKDRRRRQNSERTGAPTKAWDSFCAELADRAYRAGADLDGMTHPVTGEPVVEVLLRGKWRNKVVGRALNEAFDAVD